MTKIERRERRAKLFSASSAAKKPSYEQVEMGITGHAETVQVDPTDGAGQFCDHGTQYRPIIFYADGEQKRLAEQSRDALERSHRIARVMPQIVPASTFWRAEDCHQRYYRTDAVAYRIYRAGCGRDASLRELWGPPH